MPFDAAALIRPKHWIKNLVIFAPLIFARELFAGDQVVAAARAFLAFCLTASAVYIINDIADAEADRAHPLKRNRPIASGRMSVRSALIVLGAVIALCVPLCIGMRGRFILLLAVYFAMNIAYTFRLKNVMLLDVFVIAAGFMLRVLAGAYAIGVEVSSWIVLCSMFISLFLGSAKRRGELVNFRESGAEAPRRVLKLYSVEFLEQMLTIAAAGAVISYALYTVAPRTVEVFGTDELIYTTVFVMYGVFRYLFLIRTGEKAENPTLLLTTDRPIIVNGILWILTCIYFIYFHARAL